MGNEQIISYNLEKFIEEIELQISNHNIIDIKNSLERLRFIFMKDNSLYLNYKLIEKEMIKLKESNINSGNDNNGEIDRKTIKFCKLFSRIPLLLKNDKLSPDFDITLNIYIDIYEYIKNQRTFLEFFISTTIDYFIELLILKIEENSILISNETIYRVLKIFEDLLLLMTSKIKFFNSNFIQKTQQLIRLINSNNFISNKLNLSHLMEFLNIFINIIVGIQEGKFNKKIKSTETYSLAKGIISEMYQKQLFSKVCVIITSTNQYSEENIIKCLTFLNSCLKFEIIISERYLRPSNEIKKLYSLIDPLQTDLILIKVLEIISDVLMISFKNSIKENFSFFLNNKKDYIGRFFLIYQYSKSECVKIKAAVVFIILGLDYDCWEIIKNKNICVSCRNTIFNFIKEILNKENFKYLDTNEDEKYTYKIVLLNDIVKMFHFYSLETTYKKVFYKEIYVLIFDVVIMLFYSYHESFRIKSLEIFQTFTFSNDCKARLYIKQNKIIIDQIKKRVISSFKKMESLVELYNETELHNKHFLKSKNIFERTQNTRYIQKFEDNLSIYSSTLENIKSIYFSFLKEFGLLISIYTNLLVNSDQSKINDFLFDNNFFEEIKRIIMYFQEPTYFNKELENKKNDYNFLTMYTNQLILIQVIYYPNASIDYIGGKNVFVREENRQYSTLLYLYNLIKNYKDNHNMLYKIIFCVNRYLELNYKFKLYHDILLNIIKEIIPFIYSKETQVMTTRESLKLLLTLTKAQDGFILGIKADSKKLHIDSANYNDLIVSYKDPLVPFLRYKDIENIKNNMNNIDKYSELLYPPYKRIFPYKETMGVVFHSNHSLVIPGELNLGKNFSISVKIFNPFPKSENFHVLLQDKTGLGAILAVDKINSTFGSFTIDGLWINSGIDLKDSTLQNRWLTISFTYSQFDNQSKLAYYLNGELIKKYDERKYFIPTNIKTIANSIDYTEPFGVFCDLKIFCRFKESEEIYSDYKLEEKDFIESDLMSTIIIQSSEQLVLKFLETSDMNDETFKFFIKLLNNYISNIKRMNIFAHNQFILKIAKFINSTKYEIKKDVAKFIFTIS